MRNIFILLAVLSLSAPSWAQVGTLKWPMRSRSDVTSALTKTRGDLRATYEVLVCAARQGYPSISIDYYDKIVRGKEFDATAADSAAFAFAYDLGHSFRPWNWKQDAKPIPVKGTQAMAQYFRERALSGLPNSPEVLTMRAFWGATQSGEKRDNAYFSALKAVKKAPDWADAYYWLASASKNYAYRFSQDESKRDLQKRLGLLALRAYDKAEKLDPTLRPHLFQPRAYAYELVGDKKSAQMIPILAEAHLKAFPQYGSWYRQKTGRTIEDYRQMWKEIADQVSQKATS